MGYAGLIASIPAGQGSLNTSENRTTIPATDLTEAEGIVYEGNVWRKEPGRLAYGGVIAGTPAIVAAHHWRHPYLSTDHMLFACMDGKLYLETLGDPDAVTLQTGMTNDERGIFVPCGSEVGGEMPKLVYFNGQNAGEVLTGSDVATHAMAHPPDDWQHGPPFFGVLHNSRLCAGGSWYDPHRIYYSINTDHEDFKSGDSGSLAIYPGVGQRFVAGLDVNGLLFLFKHPVGIYWLDDSDVDIANWRANRVNEQVGVCESAHAALPISVAGTGDVLFLAPSGNFHLLSALQVAPGGTAIRRSNLSEAMQIQRWTRENVNLGLLRHATSTWYESKSEAVWSLPSTHSVTNDLRLVFDFSRFGDNGQVRFSYSRRDNAETLFTRLDDSNIARPSFGDGAGQVYLLDQETRSPGTASFTLAETDFAWLDGRLANTEKAFQFLEVITTPKNACPLTVNVFIDGRLTQTLTLDAGNPQARKRLRGRGNTLALQFIHPNLLPINTQDFSIDAVRVYLKPSAWRSA